MEKDIPYPGEVKIVEQWGNSELLTLHKTAFLCSREVPASVVLKCFDWAIAQRDAGKCVISGFHSRLEKDVLAYLLKGKQPVIVALARGLKKRIDPSLKKALDGRRLLIVTPFGREETRVTNERAMIRNRLMVNLAQEIVVGYAQKDGNVAHLLRQMSPDMNVTYFH